MNDNIRVVGASLHDMAAFLKEDCNLPDVKLWENTHIKHQIDRRKEGDTFSVSDHIRAMVYSMLSAGIPWERMDGKIDLSTGRLLSIDEVFHQYDPEWLLQCTPEQLRDEVKNLHCASQYTRRQMTALLETNIPKLLQFDKECGSIDRYYQRYINGNDLLPLVKALVNPRSKDKMGQMAEALIAEYLRNVGYDIAKPDRHIRRILGSKYLGCSERQPVPVYETFTIVEELAKASGLPIAQTDYILWSYCAKGYGEICTVEKPKCEICKTKIANICKLNRKGE